MSAPFEVEQEESRFYLKFQGERYSGPFPRDFCEGMVESLNMAWNLGFAAGAQAGAQVAIGSLGAMAKQAIG